MLVLLVSFGLRSSLGIFLRPMSGDLGWGREVFAFAMALQNLLWVSVSRSPARLRTATARVASLPAPPSSTCSAST